jgi:(2R)-ethylmalonyl-CoA mutase
MVNVVASISFFVNAGIRFVEETCKMRAFTQMWDRICSERYGITDPKARRFRYGVQVNSLGLTEAQPENNVQRIVLEALGVTLSKDARARSLQLPAWNEALGLPRPWDQQWALRIQQVLAYETDLLEYDDIFEGSKVVEAKTAELIDAAQAELDDVLALGGAFEAIDELKGRLVRSHAERMRRIESGDLKIVGVNSFTETAESPLDGDDNILRVDPGVAEVAVAELAEWRSNRDNDAVKRSLDELRRVARSGDNIMPASIDLAHAGGTTGEWAAVLREEFGEYRAPTGVAAAVPPASGRWPNASRAAPAVPRASWWPSPASTGTPTVPSRSPWPPETPASRSSTRASASRPSRSLRWPATKMSTWWAFRSCRAATSSSCPTSSGCCVRPAWRHR